MEFDSFFEPKISGRVAVIGDAIIDRYIHGKIARISPEAPVPVLLHQNETKTLGGAGNVAVNIAAMGGDVSLICMAGNDTSHETLRALLKKASIPSVKICQTDGRRTTVKTRFLASGQQVLRHDEEDSFALRPSEEATLRELVQTNLEGVQCVVLSDYGKGIFAHGFTQWLIKLCQAKGIRTIVDPKGTDYGKYQGASLVTPNLKELGEAVASDVKSDEDVIRAAQQLIHQHGFTSVLATRSEDGMSVISQTEATHIPTAAREVYDVSGAGDTVVAAMAVSFARAIRLEDAAVIANAAAGVAVSKRGTATVSTTEIQLELLRQRKISPLTADLTKHDEAKTLVKNWREQGLKIGFTNGCFDILHFGHTSLLERCRAQCDRLVVGLNADMSVRRLKGPTRPVNPQSDRSAVLSALRAVDLVVMFEGDDPYSLIDLLQPDLLFKGGDYEAGTVIGGDIVRARGGEVIILELESGRSTTATIERAHQ